MTATLEHKAPHSATTRVEYVLPSVNIREEEDADRKSVV